jgi:hypothetical protein|tara:strand:- start:3038 stop:3694 length:657 start_codon:yes stop_codon:yes gene_type:complete
MVKSGDGDVIMRSTNNILANGKHARKAYDQMWNVASRAPVFCKITKKAVSDGKGGTKQKKFYRTSRLIGAHAYNIAASGAAMRASRIMAQDCELMRVDKEDESSRAPWLPSVSKGAKMVLEQWLCALSQEAAYKAHAVRHGAGYSKRLNLKHTKIGWESTFESVFNSTTLMPKTMVVLPLDAKKSKKSKGKSKGEAAADDDDDDEYDPPAGEDADGGD